MKKKIVTLGISLVWCLVVGFITIAFKEPSLQFVAGFCFILFGAISLAYLLNLYKEAESGPGKLYFLVVCEKPHNFGCPSVADAVTDYLCLLLNPVLGRGGKGLNYDFCKFSEAEKKIEENMQGPESEEYKLVFLDSSAPGTANMEKEKIRSNHRFMTGWPILVEVGCVSTSIHLHFTAEEWSKNRKDFQKDLERLLGILNLLPTKLDPSILE